CTNAPEAQFTNSPIHQFTNSPIHQFTNSPIHQFVYNSRLMWQHNYQPVAGSVGISALVAAIPILVLFFMIGIRRKPAWMAAASALVSAFAVAFLAYGMPAK